MIPFYCSWGFFGYLCNMLNTEAIGFTKSLPDGATILVVLPGKKKPYRITLRDLKIALGIKEEIELPHGGSTPSKSL